MARLDKPAGWLLLMWPCWFAVILGSDDYSINYYFLFLFALGSICLRGAGCVVNDIIDRKIDAQVERTKNRPLASGALNVRQALALLFVLLLGGLFVFVQLNSQAKILSLCAAGLAVVYPFVKRFFGYPQLFLGIVFNSGALIAWAQTSWGITNSAWLLYAGCVFWTIAYDTIYGHMDKKDDVKIGVRSSSISFGKGNRIVIIMCYAAFYALVATSAQLVKFPSAWFLCTPTLMHTMYIALKVDFNDAEDCMEKFKDNAFITGFLYFASLYISKILG